MKQVLMDQIDKADYKTLLHWHRYKPIGDSLFQGDVGRYFFKVMKEKRDQLTEAQQVSISKAVGFSRRGM